MNEYNTAMAKYCDEIVQEICGYIRDGDTQEAAYEKAGIGKETFYGWMREKTDFSDAIRAAKKDFLRNQYKDAVQSLYKRATGYDVEEPEITYGDKDGKPYIKQKKVRTKHIPADPQALKFLLTNLYPDDWQDRQKNELTGSLSNRVQIEYVDSGINLAHSEDEITD